MGVLGGLAGDRERGHRPREINNDVEVADHLLCDAVGRRDYGTIWGCNNCTIVIASISTADGPSELFLPLNVGGTGFVDLRA